MLKVDPRRPSRISDSNEPVSEGATYASVGLLESAHRIVDPEASVRNFTHLDVVDSSSLQLGLFVGGLLVAASATGESRTPYVVFVIATALAATAVISRTTRLAAQEGV